VFLLLGRRDALLARGKALQIGPLVARRENRGKLARIEQDARAWVPDLYLDSTPDSSKAAEDRHWFPSLETSQVEGCRGMLVNNAHALVPAPLAAMLNERR
jgi:hypothetical protein